MNVSIVELLEIVINAAWRRKRLIIAPILVFSALAVIAVFAWPRAYTTRALLMLQEHGSSDPLSGGGGASRQGRLKAEEIDTLLKSERVLVGSVLDFNLGKKPLSASDLEGEIKSLRKRVGVSVVGSDFIEIELKDSARDGIGERLSIILTRFFERLLEREDSMTTARAFALQQRHRDVATTSSAIEDWLKRAAATGTAGVMLDGRLAELRKTQADLEQRLKQSASSLLHGDINLGMLDQFINDEMRIASARMRTSDPLAGLSDRLGVLKALEAELAAYRSLGREISELLTSNARALANSLREQPADPEGKIKTLTGEWESLDARYAEAVDQYGKHILRAKKGSGPSMAPFGLIAPDSIRIIDEPRDPATPTTSLLKILVACLAAGIGIGGGLAAIAEQLDERIYDHRGLGNLAGTDAVFRVPAMPVETEANHETDNADDDDSASRRSRLAVVSRA